MFIDIIDNTWDNTFKLYEVDFITRIINSNKIYRRLYFNTSDYII